MLKQRIITGVILALVVVGSILYADSAWISIFFAGVLFAAARELIALTLNSTVWVSVLIAAVFALLFWWSLPFITTQLHYWQALAGLVAWILIAGWLPFYRHSGKWPLLVRVILLGLGLDLLWICVHGLVFLHQNFGQGEWLLLYMLSLVWVADIGAYFSGHRFGKHKLAPTISPGKTWEGVGGGVLANLIWILLVYHLSAGWGLGLLEFILIGLSTSVISVVGDLFESVLKREAGVKDSGKLLPGHGGVLDRIDSVIAASPVFVAGTILVGA